MITVEVFNHPFHDIYIIIISQQYLLSDNYIT